MHTLSFFVMATLLLVIISCQAGTGEYFPGGLRSTRPSTTEVMKQVWSRALEVAEEPAPDEFDRSSRWFRMIVHPGCGVPTVIRLSVASNGTGTARIARLTANDAVELLLPGPVIEMAVDSGRVARIVELVDRWGVNPGEWQPVEDGPMIYLESGGPDGYRGAMDPPREIVVEILRAVGLHYLEEVTPRC